jgi:hypothetical protein
MFFNSKKKVSTYIITVMTKNGSFDVSYQDGRERDGDYFRMQNALNKEIIPKTIDIFQNQIAIVTPEIVFFTRSENVQYV